MPFKSAAELIDWKAARVAKTVTQCRKLKYRSLISAQVNCGIAVKHIFV